MCGIVGILEAGPAGSPDELRARLRHMNEALVHRGPDGAGEFFEASVGLAMRRLAVIDLDTGDQPVYARGGRVVAFQNGEIYNYRSLRQELVDLGHGFVTQGDTEVIAHGFVAWGMDGLLERLDGMYAIAILDRDAGRLWLARDRYGEKPLFVHRGAGRFAWGSSLKALARLPGLSLSFDATALDHYLALHFVPGRRTIFSEVERVLPGERLCLDVDSLEAEASRYYAPPVGELRDRSDQELLDLLRDAVRSRLESDVPLGVFLSGGLDSSLIAALAAREVRGIDTFSMGFEVPRYDESAFAREVAEHVGSTHHEFVFDSSSFHTLLPEVAVALDEPVGDPALLPVYWMSREARRHVKVVLSGEGADELFGGYGYYRFSAPSMGLRERWRRRRSRGGVPAGERMVEHDGELAQSGYPLVLARERRRALLEGSPSPAPDRFETELSKLLAAAASPLQRATLADVLTWLPDDLLVKFDRMTMAHGLEGRAPYLEPRLAAAALCLPPERRTTWLRRKPALAALGASLLPRSIPRRRKHGFVLPMQRWLVEWFERHADVEAWLEGSEIEGLDLGALALEVRREVAVGVRDVRALFAIVLLVEWYRHFSDSPPAPRS